MRKGVSSLRSRAATTPMRSVAAWSSTCACLQGSQKTRRWRLSREFDDLDVGDISPDFQTFLAGLRSAGNGDVAPGYAQRIGDEFDQGLVGPVLQGGRGDADLQGFAVNAGHFGAPRAGLGVDANGNATVRIPAVPLRHRAVTGSAGCCSRWGASSR